ncbi:MAG TPA: hypothetical protein VK846_06735 [Candidatus Limnocylindria bacterium]|nr:hypothetical protein [Candidatus Limnocylindria bacterium]
MFGFQKMCADFAQADRTLATADSAHKSTSACSKRNSINRTDEGNKDENRKFQAIAKLGGVRSLQINSGSEPKGSPECRFETHFPSFLLLPPVLTGGAPGNFLVPF